MTNSFYHILHIWQWQWVYFAHLRLQR